MFYNETTLTKISLWFGAEEKELFSKVIALVTDAASEAQQPGNYRDVHLLQLCDNIINNLQELATYSNEISH